MHAADWALLGIEPTADLVAIKKAYAARLKVTRPDDDAQAYQALRDAYERVQRWAVTPLATPPRPTAVVLTVPTVPPAPWTTAPTPSVPPASDLVEQAEALWQQGGNAGLQATWPKVLAQLQARPLTQRDEDALLFAQWLVASVGLPAAVCRSLQRHFDWQHNYRVAHVLGDELVEAVLERLDDLEDEARQPPPRHPLALLLALWRTPDRRSHALGIAVCGRPGWLRQLSLAGEGRKPRLDKRQRRSLHGLMALAALPRVLLLMAALAPAGLALGGMPGAVLASLAVLLFPLHLLAQGALWLAGSVLVWDLSLLAGGGSDVQAWRVQPARLALAAAALVAAIALAAWPAEGRAAEITQGLGLMALGASVLVVRWTQSTERSPAVVACFIAAWTLSDWALGALMNPVGPAAAAALWTLLGTAAHEDRAPFARWIQLLTWPASRTLACADCWSWRFIYWPSAAVALLALGGHHAERPPAVALALAALWAAWTTALFIIQARLDRAAQAALSKDLC
ncbi:MAG TPA: J domain-containing protein [Roseateles sp.]